MKKNYKIVLCTFGQYEEESISFVPFWYTGEKPLTSWMSAIKSLSKFLYNYSGVEEMKKLCCQDYSDKNFCAICGAETNQQNVDDDFRSYLLNFHETRAHQLFETGEVLWTMDVPMHLIDCRKAIVLHGAEALLLAARDKDSSELRQAIKEQKQNLYSR